MKSPKSTFATLTAFAIFCFGASPVFAATLIHDYEFQGNLNDSLGGQALVANGGTVNSDNYTFAPDQGLSLSNWVSDPNDIGTYTMDLSLKLTLGGPSGYSKIIDFKNRASDQGLYRDGARLNFYQGGNAPADNFLIDSYYRIVMTRDGATNLITGYLDGVEQFNFTDNSSEGVFGSANNIINLLRDDGNINESGGGVINQFRVYSGAMTALEVAGLGGAKPIPEPSAALLGIMVLLGSCFRRSRK